MVFEKYAAYYDLLYNDKNYIAETDYIQKLLTNYKIPRGGGYEDS